jgi:4-hydroxy-3-methylbut-2-enyl diphosphate reductase
MKVNLAKSAGFCFGVNRAINIALMRASRGEKVYMLGDIVHNEKVVRQMQEAGIKKIKKLIPGKDKILLIRAHGACRDTIKKARKLGFKIVDATCPMVKEIHRIVQNMERKQHRIIVIGDKLHDEVHGIIGQLKREAIIIQDIKHMPLDKIKKIKKACVVAQSTQNLDKFLKITEVLKGYIPNLRSFNTICRPTRMKQKEIKTMPLDNDAMIIIGSKNSANTKRLYEIAKSLNKHSYWINSKEEIKRRWFRNAQRVGVSAGASTPDSTIREIIRHICLIRNQ